MKHVDEAEHRIELLGLEPKRLCQRLHDLRRRAVVAALDLAQVGIRDAGQLGQVPLRYLGEPALGAHELTESG